MEIPIACSLDATGAQIQLDEWRSLLQDAVLSTEREDATRVRMRLRPESENIARIVDLAQREVACCPFFTFAIEIDARGVALTATVPGDAAAILDGFADLASS